jgi:hypothetical protein
MKTWTSVVCAALAAASSWAGQASVRIEGRTIAVNGQAEIPRGLFGAHSVPLTEQAIEDLGIECYRQIFHGFTTAPTALRPELRYAALRKLPVLIDCQGDRYTPATVLTNPNFAAFFGELGRKYAQVAKDAKYPAIVEFWNEAYLNWADRSRKNYDNKYYDISKAADNGPVTIKGWPQPLEHLRWKRLWAKDERGQIAWGVKLPEGAKVGDTFRSRQTWYWTDRREQTFTVAEEWHVHDPTQTAWWSGRQNRDFYLWMFLPFARELKATWPDVKLVAGWSFGFHHGDWAVWRELCQPILDAAPQLIDGLSEHHYGVDPRTVGAWYEVAVAYSVSRHNRWIRVYNTECSGRRDPAVYRDSTTQGAGEGGEWAWMSATYALRDILELACLNPDKVGSRTAHEFPMIGGTATALRFLRDLRGPMVRCHSSDGEVWAVASINSDKLVAVLFNNAREARAIDLKIDAPEGTKLIDEKIYRIGAGADGNLAVLGTPAPVRELGARQAIKVVWTIQGQAPRGPQLQRRQFFAREGVLHEVAAGKSLALHVAADGSMLQRADRAAVRVVLEGAIREAKLTVNGKVIDLPDRPFTVDIPIDRSILRPDNELAFTAGDSGLQVQAASIWIDAPSDAR